MLKCPGLWQQGVRVDPQRQSGADLPNGEWVCEPIDQDPVPDYDTEALLYTRIRLSDCAGRTMSSFSRKQPRTRAQSAKSDFLSIKERDIAR